MPWRRTRDPYRIWLSEVMLQQTQVVIATPFYQSFLARFPDVRTLAEAPLPDVLAAWAGLGYYRRARALHQAARIVVRDHGARVPDDPEAFARLPGVGRYTTGAVQSIAFGRALPVLDGNVARVLARLHAMQVSVRDPRGARALWALAAAWMPTTGPGEWNQALMELGAIVCTPRAPGCPDCPVRAHCRGASSGRPEAFPAAPLRPATRRVRRAIVLIERHGKLLMRRLAGPRLDGLWEPPGVEVVGTASERSTLAGELERLGLAVTLEPTRDTLRHRITRHDIAARVWRGTLEAPAPRATSLAFVDPAAPRVAITALARRAGEWALNRPRAAPRGGA